MKQQTENNILKPTNNLYGFLIIIFVILFGLGLSFLLSLEHTPTPTYIPNLNKMNTTSTISIISEAVLEDIKDSIVYIRHDVTGCCVSYDEISTRLGNSGSGVIFYKEQDIIHVLTSRHVVDCIYLGSCEYPTEEKISVKISNNFYAPFEIIYAPGNLDLAIMKIRISDQNVKPVSLNFNTRHLNQEVVAIGYPYVPLESGEPILYFSMSQGKVTNFYNLLTFQGLSFTAIESDALSGPGASGGGLFNDKGELIGIITWGSRIEQITIGIDVNVLSSTQNIENNFFKCEPGTYIDLDKNCCPYGTKSSADGTCMEPCGGPKSFCQKPKTCCKDVCYYPCIGGYIRGSDCVCHEECGGEGKYCQKYEMCCKDKCVKCEEGYYLSFFDCKCYPV